MQGGWECFNMNTVRPLPYRGYGSQANVQDFAAGRDRAAMVAG
jgi:hypothetical protein